VLASEADIGLQMVEQKSFRAAIGHLNRALEQRNPDSKEKADLLLARGLSYLALLDDANAAADFQEVLGLSATQTATSAEAGYQLGVMYRTGRGVV